jgi:two-component system nitrate/nitrite sensor histidine kinase NarX
MKIMSERAVRIGAEVKVVSGPGRGTTVTLTLPHHPVTGGGATSAQDVSPPPNPNPATEETTR